jgi:hypothetical protein
VKFLPETEAWAASMHKAGAVVQYALRLDEPRRAGRPGGPARINVVYPCF